MRFRWRLRTACQGPGDARENIVKTMFCVGARLDPPVWLEPGDAVGGEAEGIGTLRNTIADEA